ncbi:E3 ubiquitin-protein ligase MARCH11 [Gouania willdenowi]|uniref:E3 ubiquitin-protein ligase MARCH11 n=1 Tax=Gouania willdenowi TaxID=441366 RepID=UPI0010541540|nr:E3 ubiquitin-protein ligase MARCH11 [Gouania willdenowi]
MSTEEGEARAGTVTATVPQHQEEGDGHGAQGRPSPVREDVSEAGQQQEDPEKYTGEDNDGGPCSSEDGAVGGTLGKVQGMHSNSSSENCIPTPSCRICFQGAEQGDLLNPCRCDGSVRYTHQHCLLKWISERGCWTCELCCYRFQVIAINMKRPWQWQSITITLVEKVQIIAVFLGSLFLVASISWLLWSALSPQAVWQRRDVLFQICYGMYGFMDLVCVGESDTAT